MPFLHAETEITLGKAVRASPNGFFLIDRRDHPRIDPRSSHPTSAPLAVSAV